MKKCLNANKIFLIILILIIISGIITLGVFGFKKSSEYSSGTRIEIYIAKGYEKQDIINIAKESFTGREISFDEVEKLNQIAAIKVKDYTKEELNNYKAKIAEKYNTSEESLQVYEVAIPATRVETVVKPYILPTILITVLSLIYISFRNLKSGKVLKTLIEIVLKLILIAGVYFSIILLFRLPFGTYTMPIALLIYIISMLIIIYKANKSN